ncbi:MAG TPA: glycerol-3-phosphate 1-O-acyltransferase PlsY [Tepidisphaeraceae bacterium]|jgi:glycerol-3-phosphate acyltransferase PlsY|nr:glycerol-3-phosphate 1-O-acyltransferase PlsY [Tepidisphaeraceae bacterium]
MTTAPAVLLMFVPLAYLAGSVPFGLIVGLANGVDPRKAGSGNIGATNLGRLLGGKFFALVFVLDMLKGLIPTLAAGAVLHFNAMDAIEYALWLSVGFAAIVGHMCSVFLGFKGGKGVATSAGVILGVFPYYTIAAVVALLTFAVVFKLTRYVSVGSILAASVFTVVYLFVGLARRWDIFGRQLPLLLFAVLVTAMIIFKHRANLVRLRAGTELRFGAKA